MLMLTARQHGLLHDGQTAHVTVFVAQTLEDPLRRVPLLPRPFAILFQDLIDDPYKRVQLWSRWQPACEDEWRDTVANAETSGSSGACSRFSASTAPGQRFVRP